MVQSQVTQATDPPASAPAGPWPVVVLVLGVAGGAAVALWQARRTWFFGDEWVFLLDDHLSLRGVFEPHNEHLTALPKLVYAVMVAVFGIGHHTAYAAMPVLLHVGVCTLLYVLLRRYDVSPWPAVAATLVLAFLCGGLGENLLWAFQIGFLGSAFFGLLTLLLVDAHPGTRGLVAGWAAAVVCLLCSGMALPMIGFAALVTLFTQGLRRAVALAVVPAALYLAWYAAFGRSTTESTRGASPREILGFVHVGVSSIWEQVLRLPGWGGVVLVGLVLLAALLPAPTRAKRLALGGAGACVVMYTLLAFTRAGLGTEFALASRYAYFGVLLTLPAFAVVVDAAWTALLSRTSRVPGRALVPAALLTAALVAIAVSGSQQTVAFADARVTLSPGLAQEIDGTVELIRRDEPVLTETLEPAYNPDVTLSSLRAAVDSGRLDPGDPSPRAVLAAASVLQVAVGPTSYGLAPAADVELHHIDGTVPATGCAELRAGKDAYLGLGTGQEISLTSSRDRIKARLVAGGLRGPVLVFDTVADAPSFVASRAAATLRVDVKPGTLVVCVGS